MNCSLNENLFVLFRWWEYIARSVYDWAAEDLEKDWVEYPVLHLDLNGSKYMDPEDLDTTLDQHLNDWEADFGITPRYKKLSARFKDVIEAAYKKTGQKAVIL